MGTLAYQGVDFTVSLTLPGASAVTAVRDCNDVRRDLRTGELEGSSAPNCAAVPATLTFHAANQLTDTGVEHAAGNATPVPGVGASAYEGVDSRCR